MERTGTMSARTVTARTAAQTQAATRQWLADLGVALGALVLEWALATLACVALVIVVTLSLAVLSPLVGSGPGMCLTAAWMGLVWQMVSARWPRGGDA